MFMSEEGYSKQVVIKTRIHKPAREKQKRLPGSSSNAHSKHTLVEAVSPGIKSAQPTAPEGMA